MSKSSVAMSLTADCERYLDAVAALEPQVAPSPDVALLLREHPASCVLCRGLQQGVQQLQSAGARAMSDRQRVARAYQKAERQVSAARQQRWFLGALAACAAAMLMVVLPKGAPSSGFHVSSGEVLARGEVIRGEVPARELLQTQAQAARFVRGETVLALGPSAQASLDGGAALLTQGELAARGALEVQASSVRVVSQRAVFSVAVLAFEVRVQVLEGEVEVIAARASQRVSKDSAWSSEGSVVTLEDESYNHAADLLGLAHRPAKPVREVAPPLVEAPKPAQSEPPAPRPARQHRRQPKTSAPEATLSVQEMAAIKAASIDELLQRARACKRSGALLCAEAAYEEVVARNASSPEALTVQVPLSQLLMQRGKIAAAQKHARAYLEAQPHGPLAQEALWLLVLAARELGQVAGEKALLKQFVGLYPQSPNLAEAQQRLGELP